LTAGKGRSVLSPEAILLAKQYEYRGAVCHGLHVPREAKVLVSRLRGCARVMDLEGVLAMFKRCHDDAKRAGRDFLWEMAAELKARYEQQRPELFAMWERVRALPKEVRERLEHAVRI
jgi:hypothetical protein